MGGRGSSSGLSKGGLSYDKLGILKNTMSGVSFDDSRLTGTDRQKQYAHDILSGAYNSIDDMIDSERDGLRRYYARTGKKNDELWDRTNAKIRALIDVKKIFQKSLSSKNNTAGNVIGSKRAFEQLLPAERQKLEQKYYEEYKKKRQRRT